MAVLDGLAGRGALAWATWEACDRPSQSGGGRVTLHLRGRDEILGLAHSDHDLDDPDRRRQRHPEPAGR
ncbi:hypothetical protein [Streptomyces sp. AK04-3B]|uniref:hypothetical protein n=1 Tax=Streptomyces sp. AK04-3B TaxID=3028650 RepID=UPI0029AA21FB|nr:hypothetical protein [Streptomyces sp. AK04-3B]MDX3801705.1 hypothetical protein [Streptomyces sp. AK04-3B]